MTEYGVQFRFVEFVAARGFRGAEAARVEVIEEGEPHLLWMSIEDLRANGTVNLLGRKSGSGEIEPKWAR